MAAKQYIPQFPYTENQIVLTSDRVMLHSRKDSIFLFGKRAIGASTTGTFNVDANEGVHISSPKIELGLNAADEGYALMKAEIFLEDVAGLMQQLAAFCDAISKLESNTEGLAISIPGIVAQSRILKNAATIIAQNASYDVDYDNIAKNKNYLSTTTYTR